MQNPQHDIKNVLHRLLTAESPDVQKDTLNKYFTEDVAFRSPFFHIAPRHLSREDVLGVYQWYRVMSPKNQVDVTNIVFDDRSNMIILETTQIFHIRFSPFDAAPAKYLTRFKLKKQGKKYVISSQEDFYHPDDLMNLVLPPIAPFVRFLLSVTSYGSAFAAKSAQVLGVWRVSGGRGGGEGGGEGKHSPGGEPGPMSEDSQDSEETKMNNVNEAQWKPPANGKQHRQSHGGGGGGGKRHKASQA